MTERCDQEIFEQGKPIAVLDARPDNAETWVQALSQRADARVDWHYLGGIANVLHLGDAESRERVIRTMEETRAHLNGKLRLWA